MKFSIITPTFNSAPTIENCVHSVLRQNNSDFEHIIIDNQSEDHTLLLIKDIYNHSAHKEKLSIVSEPDDGISDAFNKGITRAKGEIICILNSDDYFTDTDLLEKAEKIFEDRTILFMHGNVFFEDRIYGSNIRRPLLCPITEAMPYNHPGMFMRKELFTKYGMFDVSYNFAMDFELICRLEVKIPDFRKRGYYLDDKPIVHVHGGGVSWKYEIEGIKEVKRALLAHGLWNSSAKKSYYSRLFRTRLKQTLTAIGMRGIVKSWRRAKWS